MKRNLPRNSIIKPNPSIKEVSESKENIIKSKDNKSKVYQRFYELIHNSLSPLKGLPLFHNSHYIYIGNILKTLFRYVFIIFTYPIQYYTQTTLHNLLLMFINLLFLFIFFLTLKRFCSLLKTNEVFLIEVFVKTLSLFGLQINLETHYLHAIVFGLLAILINNFYIERPEVPEFIFQKNSQFAKVFVSKLKSLKVFSFNSTILSFWLGILRLFYGPLAKMKEFKGIKLEEFDNREFKATNAGRAFLNKLYLKITGENLFKEYKKGIKDLKEGEKIVLLIHGVNSSSNAKTMRALIYSMPVISVSINLRGQRLSSTMPFGDYSIPHMGFYGDIIIGMEYIKEQYPTANVILLGCSLGGNLIINSMRDLIDLSKYPKIIGLIGLSPALDFEVYSKTLTTYLKKLFEKAYLHKQKQFFKNNTYLLLSPEEKTNRMKNKTFSYSDVSESALKKLNEIEGCKSMKELDTLLLEYYGEESLDSHYTNISAIHKLKDIRVPILIVHSENDNILSTVVPFEDIFRHTSNLVYCKLKFGAHLLYYTPWGDYSLKVIINQFIADLN